MSHISKFIIKSSDCEKILGINIDSKLHYFIFDDRVEDLCKKANRKLLALARATGELIIF